MKCRGYIGSSLLICWHEFDRTFVRIWTPFSHHIKMYSGYFHYDWAFFSSFYGSFFFQLHGLNHFVIDFITFSHRAYWISLGRNILEWNRLVHLSVCGHCLVLHSQHTLELQNTLNDVVGHPPPPWKIQRGEGAVLVMIVMIIVYIIIIPLYHSGWLFLDWFFDDLADSDVCCVSLSYWYWHRLNLVIQLLCLSNSVLLYLSNSVLHIN